MKILLTMCVMILATGCLSEESSYDSTFGQESNEITQDSDSTSDTDDLFVSLLQDEYPSEFGRVDENVLIDMGHTICDSFDTGMSFTSVITTGISSGYTAEEVGGLVGVSIAAYCPEFEELIP